MDFISAAGLKSTQISCVSSFCR